MLTNMETTIITNKKNQDNYVGVFFVFSKCQGI